MQFSLEGFLKNYRDYPFSVNDQISLANKGADYGVIGDEEVTSTSKGRVFGAEFQARISSAKGYNLNLSYTLVRSEFQDGTGKIYCFGMGQQTNFKSHRKRCTQKKGGK